MTATNTPSISLSEVRAIAKEAYIYAYPIVDAYRIMRGYSFAPGGPEFKAPPNTLKNIPRVFTPTDTLVQTPNSDTPYSLIVCDLRDEPIVLSVPSIEKERYYSIQLVDAYTHNFAYIGSRTTGNGAGHYLVAGPDWIDEKPAGITAVIRCETKVLLGIYRTQVYNPTDLPAVVKIQSGYGAQPLSAYLGKAAPLAEKKPAYVESFEPAKHKTSLHIFAVFNFVLGYCPTVPSEQELMARFARIGIGAGRTFAPEAMTPELISAIELGIADAWGEYDKLKSEGIDTGKVTSGDLFGDRAALNNNYLRRMAGAIVGILGNSPTEAMYPIYTVDGTGAKLNGATARYIIRFPANALPATHAFWSLTMYELPAQLLVANPLERYLINSGMLPQLARDADGGLTLFIQHESPGAAREANWLPAPKGPFFMAMRLYWPKAEALNGTWKAPQLERQP